MAIIRTKPENILTSQDPGLTPIRIIEDRKVLEEINYNPANPLSLPSNYTVNQVTTVVNNIIQNNPPTGANGQVQINENGQFVGDGGLTYEPTTDTLTTGTLDVGNIHVTGVANLGNVETLVILGGSPGEVLTTDGTGLVHWDTPYPSIAGKNGKFLVTDGINVNWSNIAYSSFATTTDVSNAIGNLINSAPTALDTLGELANALGNSGDFTISVVNQLANKVNTSALALVATSGNFSDLNYKPNLSDYLPSQASNSGKYLTTNGTSASWGTVTIPTDIANLTDTTSLLGGGGGGGGIALTDISVGADNSASGGGNVSYNNSTGVFTYTPPVIPDVSGFVTGTPWTSEGYLTTITNIFDQDLNTSNNVTFNSVITSNVHAVNGAPVIGAPTNAVGGAGSLLTISAGDGGIAATGINAGNGGNLTITAGDAGSDIGNPSWGALGGNLVLRGGNSSRPYHGSDVQIHSGDSVTSPGLISLHTGTNQWTFGKDGNLTVPGSLINDTSIVLSAPAVFNICTIATAGSGYNTGSALKATTGGSGTGMTVGIGYGLSNQLASVNVVDPGTGYVNGDVITVSEGTGGTFVLTKYNQLANQTNNNTIQTDLTFANTTLTLPIYGEMATDANMTLTTNLADTGNTRSWEFGADGNLTLPAGGDILDSTGTSVLGGGASTGNVTFDDNIVIGTGTQDGYLGLYLAVGPDSVANAQYLQVRGGDNTTHIHLDTGNNEYFDQYFGNDNKFLKLEAGITGNVLIGTDDNNGNLYRWTFGSDSNLTLPNTNQIAKINNTPSVGQGHVFATDSVGATPSWNNTSSVTVNKPLGYTSTTWTMTLNDSTPITVTGIVDNNDGTLTINLGGATTASAVSIWPILLASSDYVAEGNDGGTGIVTDDGTWVFRNDGNLSISGSVIPSTDNAYDLGTPTKKFRHIYTDNGSIYVGNIKLSNDNGNLSVVSVTNVGQQNESNVAVALKTDRLNSTTGGYEAILDIDSNLTVPGDIKTNPAGPSINSAITNIGLDGTAVYVELADDVFDMGDSGQITISGVIGMIQANGTWWYQASGSDQFWLKTNSTLSADVDGSTWTAYTSGGTAFSGTYNDLNIIVGNKNWAFKNDSSLSFPDNTTQTTAYRNRPQRNLNIEGGSASTVFEIDMTYVDCGGSHLRGILSQDTYDGYDNGSTTTSFDKILDGGQS